MFVKRARKKKLRQRKKTSGVVFQNSNSYISSSESSIDDEIPSEVHKAHTPQSPHESSFYDVTPAVVQLNANDSAIHRYPVTCVAYADLDNARECSLWFGDKHGHVYSMRTGSSPKRMEEKHERYTSSLCFSSTHGKIISAGSDGNILVWEPVEDNCAYVIDAARKSPITAICSSNNLVFAATGDRTISVWDLQERMLLHSFYGPLDTPLCLSSLSQNNFVAVGLDCIPRLFQVEHKKFTAFERTESYIECVSLITSSLFVCGTSLGNLLVFRSDKSKAIIDYPFAHKFGFIGDGTGFEKDGLRLPSSSPNSSNGNPIWCIASIGKQFGQSTAIATGSCDGFIRIWSINESEIREIAQARVDGIVVSLSFSHKTNSLVAAVSREPKRGRWTTWNITQNRIVLVKLENL